MRLKIQKHLRYSTLLLLIASVFLITACENLGPKETVIILHTNSGDITLRFFPETSPEHVKNFVEHSKSGFYTNTLFHRVIPSFMIQGGDPNTKNDDLSDDGKGGHGYKGSDTRLEAEFSEIPHTRGILSMARTEDLNSAGSQFFIMHQDYPELNGLYTVFGEVIDGIEVVDKIVNTPRSAQNRPNQDQRIEKVSLAEWHTSKIEKTKQEMWEEDRSTISKT